MASDLAEPVLIEKEVPSFDLTGKKAFVTGSSRGIGRAVALALAHAGADVAISCNTGGEAAESVCEAITRLGRKAHYYAHNVAVEAEVKTLCDEVKRDFGQIDILVNNAAINRDRSFKKLSKDAWDEVIDTDLTSVFLITRQFIDEMAERGWGRVIMMSSMSGEIGNFGQANYAAAKMGQVGAMQVLNLECAKYGIRVNTISPAAATRMTADVQQSSGTPPECVTPAVVYLASEACDESGIIIRAQGGRFSRQAIAFNPGVYFGPEPVTVEDFAAEWGTITDMSAARCFSFGDKVAEIIKQSAREVVPRSRG